MVSCAAAVVPKEFLWLFLLLYSGAPEEISRSKELNNRLWMDAKRVCEVPVAASSVGEGADPDLHPLSCWPSTLQRSKVLGLCLVLESLLVLKGTQKLTRETPETLSSHIKFHLSSRGQSFGICEANRSPGLQALLLKMDDE